MAFGIGTNSQAPDAGPVKGNQLDIACLCWFTKTGKMIPVVLKVEDEDQEIRTIHQIQVLTQEEKMYAGIPSIEFNCKITIMKQEIDIRLIYYVEEKRWAFVYKDK